jgi:hypothetical protein
VTAYGRSSYSIAQIVRYKNSADASVAGAYLSVPQKLGACGLHFSKARADGYVSSLTLLVSAACWITSKMKGSETPL